MSLCGAIRGSGFFTQLGQISWVCQAEREAGVTVLNRNFHSAGLHISTQSPPVPVHSSKKVWRNSTQRETASNREKWKHKRTNQQHADMKDKVRRGGGGRSQAKTGEKSIFLFHSSQSLSLALSCSFFSSMVPPSLENLRRVGDLALHCCSEHGWWFFSCFYTDH